jgi:hypothetical protein
MSTARQQQGKLAVRVSLHCVLHVLSASFVYSLSRKISHTGEINASQSTGLKIAHWCLFHLQFMNGEVCAY